MDEVLPVAQQGILLARIEPLKDFSHEPNVDPREFYVELRRRVTEDEAAPAGP